MTGEEKLSADLSGAGIGIRNYFGSFHLTQIHTVAWLPDNAQLAFGGAMPLFDIKL